MYGSAVTAGRAVTGVYPGCGMTGVAGWAIPVYYPPTPVYCPRTGYIQYFMNKTLPTAK